MMACYLCEICDNLIDDDWNPGTEHAGGLICEYCATELEGQEDRQWVKVDENRERNYE